MKSGPFFWGFFLLYMGLVGLRVSRVDDNGLKLELVSEVLHLKPHCGYIGLAEGPCSPGPRDGSCLEHQ